MPAGGAGSVHVQSVIRFEHKGAPADVVLGGLDNLDGDVGNSSGAPISTCTKNN